MCARTIANWSRSRQNKWLLQTILHLRIELITCMANKQDWYPQTYHCWLIQEVLFVPRWPQKIMHVMQHMLSKQCIHFLCSELFLPMSNLCAQGPRGQYHNTPKRRSTRCPRTLNSANRKLDLRELSNVEAGIRYTYTLPWSPTQNVRLSRGVTLQS